MIPVIPIVVLGGGAVAYFVQKKRKKCMTPKRKRIYEQALKHLKDPVKLRKLADAFDKAGCKAEATMLRKRAALRELPKSVQKARKAVMKKALASNNPAAIRKVAAKFEEEGATGAAARLRQHAMTVEKAA
jgi:hypothetical protein